MTSPASTPATDPSPQPQGRQQLGPAGTPGTDMIGKALHVLRVIGQGPADGVTLTEVARQTGYPLSTCHRLAGALLRAGFAELDETTKRYQVGLAVFELAKQVSMGRGYDSVALPVLRRLAADVQESALMSVLDGDHQLYVAHVQGPLQLNVIGEPGTRGPIHCTSMGKVLIAFAPAEVRERLVATLELTGLTPRTITDRDAFAAEIAHVRACGYALSDEEHEEGIRAVGVPVMASDGLAMAAISVAAPAFRRSRDDMVNMLPALLAAARELAVTLPSRPVRGRSL